MSHEEGGDKPREEIAVAWSEPRQMWTGQWYRVGTSTGVAVEPGVFQCPQCGTGMEIDPTAKPSAPRSSVVTCENCAFRYGAEHVKEGSTPEAECPVCAEQELLARLSARVEQDYRSHWLMRHADGKEWETSCEYTLAEISGVEWKAKPVRRIEKPSSDIPQGKINQGELK